MERPKFDPENGPTVRTADLCSRVGGCGNCPGVALAKDVGLVEDEPNEVIFCLHDCHLVPQKLT